MNSNVINSFRDAYLCFSNMYCVPVYYEGVSYPSVENAYQAAKTDNVPLRGPFRFYRPQESKLKGRELKLRKGWDSGLKLSVMEELCWYKFSTDEFCRRKLLSTKGVTLIEGNTWHDNFWGSCMCTKCSEEGKNNLGQILMRIRMQLESGYLLVDY